MASAAGRSEEPPTVLDVAGGAGALSWILRNVNDINSIIVDPRTPDHRRLVKSAEFLLDHPEECALRGTEGVPTHQPLAKLIPSLVRANRGGSSDGDGGGERDEMTIFRPTSPSYMRIRVDSTLVDILRKVIADDAQQTSSITSEDGADNDSDDNLLLWDEYWKKASMVVMKSNVVYDKTSNGSSSVNDNCQILHPRDALEVFRSLDILVGFHP